MKDNWVVPEQVHFLLIPHTHWDREWYLPLEGFRHRLVRMVDKLIGIMDGDQGFRSFHLDGQTIVLEDYEAAKGRSEPLRRLVAGGRIQVGPWYVLPDEFLVSGESLIRNLEQGLAVCREFGTEPAACGYLPDMFGHTAQMPQVLKGFGLDRAVMWRGITSDVTGNEFWWESPDGSRVFTVFLPLGYGAMSNLPKDPELLGERLVEVLSELRAPEGALVAILNGSDHTEPQAHVPRALDRVCRMRPGWTWEFAGVAEWLGALSERKKPESVHRGEMRSAARTLILPGVASARLYLKKLDFEASSGLTRYAEPLNLLAFALGGPDRTGFLDYAWRLLLSNHPHDSICGCSVDAVHDEMETRYAKVMQVSGRLVAESMDSVLARLGGPGPALVLYNPAGARGATVVSGEIEGRIRHAMALDAGDGRELPLQVLETIEPEKALMDVRLPRNAGTILLGEVAQRELFGLYLAKARVSARGDTLEIKLDAATRPAGIDVQALRDGIEAELNDPAVKWVRIRANKLARQRAAALVPGLAGNSVSSFPLVRRKGPRGPDVEIGPDHVENEHVKITFEPGGTCLLTDKKTDLGYRCLRFLDLGDRGDTYNFDPVPGDASLCEAEKVALKSMTTGPVAAVMEIRHRFRVPEGLHAGRKTRSKKRVPLDLSTRITVYKDFPRVDFRTTFVNPARDHRLQTAVRVPYEADAIKVESAFALAPREVMAARLPDDSCSPGLVSTLLGREGTYSTSPQKTVTMIEKGEHGLAIMNRGMAEVDAVRLKGATRIALTMARCVGRLSRGDLNMRKGDAGPSLPTPGAQCLRPFVWDYAVMPFHGQGREGEILAAAHAFAFPEMLCMVHGAARDGAARLQLVSIDNPRIHVSALRPLAGGEAELRVVNASRETERCRIELGKWLHDPRVVDLKGDPVEEKRVRLRAGGAEAELRPGQILTIRFKVEREGGAGNG
ncbi:MAG TPA: glycoside hydrolase family 38 C-terminal domain-containing protein [bacterium]|nr:glycoside hydrolase family 38 C-terminal domain-containing protein [bacterium]